MKIEIVCLKMKAATVRQGSGAGAKYPDAFVKACRWHPFASRVPMTTASTAPSCSELIYEFEYPMIEVLYEFKKAGKAVCARAHRHIIIGPFACLNMRARAMRSSLYKTNTSRT